MRFLADARAADRSEPATAKSIELMLGTEGFNVYTTDLGEEGFDLRKLYDYARDQLFAVERLGHVVVGSEAVVVSIRTARFSRNPVLTP